VSTSTRTHAHGHLPIRFLHSIYPTGQPGDRGALHGHWNAIATQPIGLVPFQARGILPVAEEQSRTRGCQSSGISSPRARSISRSPSSPPPSFTQSPSSPRSLVRDGQTSPHRPCLVDSHSTCALLSPSPHANSFVIGTHTQLAGLSPWGGHGERERERERELLKEFKEFFNLRCKCFIKNKKIKNLLHTRAPPLLSPFKLLKY